MSKLNPGDLVLNGLVYVAVAAFKRSSVNRQNVLLLDGGGQCIMGGGQYLLLPYGGT